MPYYIHCAGLWCGLAFFVVSMTLSADAALCVARCQECAPSCRQARTYADVVGALLGSAGRAAALFALLLANWGSAIAWIRYIGDNLARFLPEAHLSPDAWALGITVPLLACAFVEDVTPLERISVVGLAAGQAFVLLMVVQAAPHLAELPAYAAAQPVVRWESAPVAMGLAVFCNEGMVALTPSVRAAMRWPRHFPRAVVATTLYFTGNYLLIAVTGDFLFSYLQGTDVSSEVSLSFDLTPVHRVAVYAYVAQLLLTFPLVMFAVCSSIEQSCFPHAPLAAHRAFRALAMLSAGGVAVAVPHFGDFIAAVGGLANSLGIYILPHLALLRAASLGELHLSAPRRAASWLIACAFGLGVGAVATGASVKDLFSGPM